jgi:hypothetical protein
MYIGVDWETVKAIEGIYTITVIPNTYSSSFLLMYSDVQR